MMDYFLNLKTVCPRRATYMPPGKSMANEALSPLMALDISRTPWMLYISKVSPSAMVAVKEPLSYIRPGAVTAVAALMPAWSPSCSERQG